MLVIISDLHLTDGSSGETIEQGAFFLLRERLFSLAYDASWRAPGLYSPIDRIDLVLLGDILDIIRSKDWCNAPSTVRPWTNSADPAFVAMIENINKNILSHNEKALSVIQSLKNRITVPAAGEDHRPVAQKDEFSGGPRVVVPVFVHYLVGNHDWFYHRPGAPYEAIRRTVIAALGLTNPPGPFPHDPNEYPELLSLYEAHHVWARHGDIFDSDNFEGDRNKSSLGDAIVIELLNRFPAVAHQKLGNQLPPDCLNGLQEIDNVRPLVMIPTWIDGLLKRTCSKEQAEAVKDVWNGLANDFLKVPFVKQHMSALKFGLKLSSFVSIASVSRGILWLKAKFEIGKEAPFYQNALNETAYKERKAHFIVYGHTHHHEIFTLRAANLKTGPLFDQIYINSGTWRAVHEMAVGNPGAEEFVGYKVMTYLVFYKDDERVGRQFESWSGALGKSS